MGKKLSQKQFNELKKIVEAQGTDFKKFAEGSEEYRKDAIQAGYEAYQQKFPEVYGLPIDPTPEPEPDNPPEPPEPEPIPTPTPEPTPEPSGSFWYDSDSDGKWSNGHTRDFSDYDHDLPKPYQNGKGMITAASGSPKGSIDGHGTFTLSGNGGHPRTYTDAINYTNVVCQYELKFNQSDATHTNQLQSRHQEEDQNEKDNENAFGGYNFMISPTEVGLKIERYHTPSGGDHINGPSKKQNLVKVGQWVRVKNTLKVDVANKSSYQSIELNNQKVIEWTAKNLPNFAVDETKFKQRSYFWNRMNPSGNASINIRKQTLSKA